MMERFLLDYVPLHGRVAVDVGANEGDWTAVLAQGYAQVYAVEPNPALAPSLRAIGANVQVLTLGAWSGADDVPFTLYASDRNTSAKGFAGGRGRSEVGSVTWPCKALDDMGIAGPVDLLKVDVEGAELDALTGAEGLLSECRCVLVEVHGEANGDAVDASLLGHGFRTRTIRNPLIDAGDPLWRINYWIAGTRP
jgi:FkbM family methyltransferase